MAIEEEDDEDSNDDWISSGADYSPKAEFKMAILAMEAVRVCLQARAKEMKQGFWNNKIDKSGNAVRVWVEDQRRMFINSVIALENLMSAECLNDERYKEFRVGNKEKNIEGVDWEIQEIYKKYAYTIFEFNPSNSGWTRTNKMFMPQIDEELLMPSPQNPKLLINVQGGWNFKVNAYYDELVPIYDKIFKELRNVIFRLKDFKKKMVIG